MKTNAVCRSTCEKAATGGAWWLKAICLQVKLVYKQLWLAGTEHWLIPCHRLLLLHWHSGFIWKFDSNINKRKGLDDRNIHLLSIYDYCSRYVLIKFYLSMLNWSFFKRLYKIIQSALFHGRSWKSESHPRGKLGLNNWQTLTTLRSGDMSGWRLYLQAFHIYIFRCSLSSDLGITGEISWKASSIYEGTEIFNVLVDF